MGYISYEKAFKLMKQRDISSYYIRKNHIISEATLQNMRTNKPIRTDSICALCELLHCQPGDLIEYVPD